MHDVRKRSSLGHHETTCAPDESPVAACDVRASGIRAESETSLELEQVLTKEHGKSDDATDPLRQSVVMCRQD